jgi:group I intron endonuclease
MNKKAIYQIKNIINNKIYIGSSVSFTNRKQEHFRDLFLNKHHCIALQRAYNKYGLENFVFEVIELVENKNNLIKREQFYIDTLNPEYNSSRIAGSCLGIKHSIETNLKNSLNNRGEKNNKAKLKDEDIINIFKLRKTNTINEIAFIYKVSYDTISRVLNRKSFKHLDINIKNTKKIYSKNGLLKLSNSRKGKKNNNIKISVFEINGSFIGEFLSMNDASKILNISVATISEIYNNKQKKPKFIIKKTLVY